MRYIFFICIFILLGCEEISVKPYAAQNSTISVAVSSQERIARAFENHESDFQVESAGVVVKILKDDEEGIPHQRFLVKLSNGITVLIAHNLSLASRVEGLQVDHSIKFYGEYEWNNKGGVIHWTHPDPRGKHPAGWIEYQGKKYQ